MNDLIVSSQKEDDGKLLDLIEDSRFQKPNSLIALIPLFGRLTATTRRLFNVLIYLSQNKIASKHSSPESQMIGHTGLSFLHPISEIVKMVCPENASGSHSIIRDAITALQMVILDSSSPDANSINSDGPGDWSQFSLIAGAGRITKNGRVFLEWSFAHQINSVLDYPKKYTRINIKEMSLLNTYCALALYEIALRYKDNPSGVTCQNNPEWWMHVLSGDSKVDSLKHFNKLKSNPKPLIDFSKSISNAWSAFKRDHLENAIKLIFSVSSIQLKLFEKKSGRSIAEVQFRFINDSESNRIIRPELSKSKDEILAIKEGLDIGLSERDCIELVNTFGIDAFLIGIKKITPNKDTIISMKPYFKKLLFNLTCVVPTNPEKQVAIINDINTTEDKAHTAEEKVIAVKSASYFDKYKSIISTMSNDELNLYKAEIEDSFRKVNMLLPSVKSSLNKEFFGGGVCLAKFCKIYDSKHAGNS